MATHGVVLPFSAVITNAMADFAANVHEVRKQTAKYAPCVKEWEDLATQVRQEADEYNEPWQRRWRAEAERSAKWYDERARTCRLRTDPQLIEQQLGAFFVEAAALEESLRLREQQLFTSNNGHEYGSVYDQGVEGGSAQSPTTKRKRGGEGTPAVKRRRLATIDEDTEVAFTETREEYIARKLQFQAEVWKSVQDLSSRMVQAFHIKPVERWDLELDVCECGLNMEIVESESKRICPRCNQPKTYVDVERTEDSTSGTRRNRTSKSKSSREGRILEELKCAQFQESKRLPHALIVSVAQECIARGYTDPATLTVPQVNSVVRDKGFNSAYKYIPQVHARLTNRVPTHLTSLDMKKVMMLFQLLNRKFPEFKGNRKTFLRYNWVGREELLALSNVETLPRKERQRYRSLVDNFRELNQDDSNTTHYRIFESMMRAIGIDTSRPGMHLLPETSLEQSVIGS